MNATEQEAVIPFFSERKSTNEKMLTITIPQPEQTESEVKNRCQRFGSVDELSPNGEKLVVASDEGSPRPSWFIKDGHFGILTIGIHSRPQAVCK